MPRLVRLLIAALGLALVADARAAVAPGFTQTAYVTGLDTPTAIAFLPGKTGWSTTRPCSRRAVPTSLPKLKCAA